jgi:hypothetical protein
MDKQLRLRSRHQSLTLKLKWYIISFCIKSFVKVGSNSEMLSLAEYRFSLPVYCGMWLLLFYLFIANTCDLLLFFLDCDFFCYFYFIIWVIYNSISGCYPFITNPDRSHCNVTLGWCQQLCLNNNVTYFSYKVCLSIWCVYFVDRCLSFFSFFR